MIGTPGTNAHWIWLRLLPLVALMAGCQQGAKVASSTQHFPQQTGFIERHVTVDGQSRSVWVFLPPDYNPNHLYPAILFLHGFFEQGNGGTNVLGAGLGPVIARNPGRWPFVTIFPQSTGSWKGEDRERLALAALKDAQKAFQIDPDRVILAGLSFGGLGVWEIGAKNPDRFAALVPVSGPADVTVVDKVRKMPVWAFASKEDPFVPIDNSIQMCDAIESHGGHARLTKFDGSEHDCWAMAVDQSQLITWMLNQERNASRSASSDKGNGGPRFQATGKLRSWNEP